MRTAINLLFLCLAFTLVLPSCVSKKKFDELQGQKDAVDKMLTEQRQKVKDLEADVESLQNEKMTLESQNADLTTQLADVQDDLNEAEASLASAKKSLEEMESKTSAMRTAIKGTFASFENSGISVQEKGHRLYVQMEKPILYGSGSTRLRREYFAQVDQLAEILKNNPNIRVQVEGHTDSKSVKQGARWQDNWDLSTARAMAVVRRLIRQGVPESQLAAVGKGEHHPANPEDSAQARSENRRAEIVILPAVRELYKLKISGGV